MSADTVLAGGGVAGLILALVGVGKLALDAWRERHDRPRTERTSAVTDAATANAVIVKTMESLHAENLRLQRKIEALEDESVTKDNKIRGLQEALAVAQEQIQHIADELDKLKTGD